MATDNIRRTVGNVVSILSSDVANRATVFILYALVARRLGAHEFGQMSVALSLFYTFQMFAAAGLKTLVTREVAKDHTASARYFYNGSFIAAVSSALAITTLVVFVRVMNYARDTAAIILLLSIGLLPYGLSAVAEAVFQARERMHFIAFANVAVNLARVTLAYFVLTRGYGLYQLIVILTSSYLALVGIEWYLLFRSTVTSPLRLDLPFCLKLIRSTSTFFGLDVIIAVQTNIPILLLSKLSSETGVGLYSAGVQLLAPMMLLLQSVVLSVFPTMCRRLDSDFRELKQMLEHTMTFLLSIVVPSVIGLFFLANPVLLLLYGRREFALSSKLLQIAVWSVILMALTHVLAYALMAARRERFILTLVAVHVVWNFPLGFVLIKHFGGTGAVMLYLFDKVIGVCEHYILVWWLLGRVGLAKLLWRPIVAGVGMAGFLAFVKADGVILHAVSGGLVYGCILLVLAVLAVGGPEQFRARYLPGFRALPVASIGSGSKT